MSHRRMYIYELLFLWIFKVIIFVGFFIIIYLFLVRIQGYVSFCWGEKLIPQTSISDGAHKKRMKQFRKMIKHSGAAMLEGFD